MRKTINERVMTIKKGPFLNGPLNFTGTEALRADMKFTGLSAAHINAYTLKIYEPTTPSMAVRVADGISYRRSATAAITELGHNCFPPYTLEHPTCALYHSI